MASLQTRISELITAIGTDYKQLRTWITGSASGDLTGLTTTDKTSLRAAINEVNAKPSGGGANLTRTLSATTIVVESDTGTDATLPAADGTNAGLMVPAQVTKLAGIEAAADVTDAGNVASSVHGASTKSAPVSADEIAVIDSAGSWALKRTTMGELSTFLIAEMGAGAPALLNTIDEIAATLGDNPNAITDLTTSISGKQAAHANLTAFSGLTLVADRLPYANGAGTLSLATFTAAARSLLDDADVATMRATLSVYSQAELGNPDTDLAALYVTAKA